MSYAYLLSLRVPVSALRLLGRLSGRSAAIARLCESFVLDSNAIASELQWRPAIDPSTAWREIGRAFEVAAR